MNFLAHFFLSGIEDEALSLGNFLGDFVKGKKYLQYPAPVQKGILLHRQIDSFTDHHPQVLQSKRRLYARYHHYSAVLVDLYYDHFLALHFKDYSPIPLPDFADSIYTLLYRHKSSLPQKAGFMLPYMKRDNWLVNYGTTEGIDRACKGIARRSPYANTMESGAEELQNRFTEFEEDFRLFFPDIQAYIKKWQDDFHSSPFRSHSGTSGGTKE